jgi:hypothetical protein
MMMTIEMMKICVLIFSTTFFINVGRYSCKVPVLLVRIE